MLANLISMLFETTVALAIIGAVVVGMISHLIHLRSDLVKIVEREREVK